MDDIVQAKKNEVIRIPEIWNQKMRKTGIRLFTNRAFESINIHTEYLKKCDNKPGIMTVTVQHAHISAASATIYVMNAGISQNHVFCYIV
ncbi:MAG TPA: hypothetical protein DCE11_09240 [Ruminiclostridium sp.]|nr:hypothetical protein [Ruminiclostridium sp.]